MVKWSLFKKSKPENEVISTEETKIITIEEECEQDDKPLAEYKETLYTGSKSSKKTSSTSPSTEQRYWRDVDSIEKKIDKLHIDHNEKPTTDVNKTVDKLIQKRKKK